MNSAAASAVTISSSNPLGRPTINIVGSWGTIGQEQSFLNWPGCRCARPFARAAAPPPSAPSCWASPSRGVALGFAVLLFVFVNVPAALTGLFERLLAAFGAAAIAALALGIARRASG
ncbi:hypothetical protein Ato02nite_079060 [Paractinoplanes toevensis]|uniref:Uncharacterized protein n=1 Tax=Paractinoplanes toevensis TaxID=571911 RepID=A0A919W9S0_9ACTN|nr:hypothetical protein Ato02nite_079060 [Actinoplanes toevensis]